MLRDLPLQDTAEQGQGRQVQSHHHLNYHCHHYHCYCRYIFSLASNPFYLWLICTIFYEAGEGYVPRTLTQLYTWVMLVFSNQWRHAETEKLNLDNETISFLRG